MNFVQDKADINLRTTRPRFYQQANEINQHLVTMNLKKIQDIMKISLDLAEKTKQKIEVFSENNNYLPSINYFSGDIYKGLRKITWQEKDYIYANEHLGIISGLYGYLNPFDEIKAYRLEMGYRLKKKQFTRLDKFWHPLISSILESEKLIINLLPLEYSKAILPLKHNPVIISPQFLFKDKNDVIRNIIINTKTTRGLMASWIIKNKIKSPDKILDFNLDGYTYNPSITKDPAKPVFLKSAQ